jgi:hypothetical protein
MQDAATIEAALARAGWVAGAEALVAGWVDHRRSELIWEETWEPDDRCRYIGTRPTGEKFVVTFTSGDHWEFSISWPDGWGSEHVRMGFVEDLQEDAWELDQAEGPFGGPTRRKVPMCSLPGQRGWRLAGDVELRFEQLREDLAAYFFITREGRLNNLWIVALNPNDLPAALESLERTPRCAPSLWAQVQGERRAWSFTAWRPVLARMRVAEYELLLVCPDPSTAVILAHVSGRLEAARQVELRALPDLEVGRWLMYARSWPRTPVAGGAAPPSTSPPAAPQIQPAGPAVSAVSPSRPPPPATPTTTTVDGRAVEVAEPLPDLGAETVPLQPASPAPEGPAVSPSERASKPAEQPKPQFSLAADASPEEIERHFSEVGAAIPPRLTGTATAVELWQAVREAHHEGALPISGNWVDLVAVLHHRGFLPHLPSDRATRAALVILAKLSPLVRRLQHRRWVLGGTLPG